MNDGNICQDVGAVCGVLLAGSRELGGGGRDHMLLAHLWPIMCFSIVVNLCVFVAVWVLRVITLV